MCGAELLFSFKVGDAANTGLDDASVALVSMHTLLIHAPAAMDIVSEAFRQLRSGRPRPVGLEMAMDVMWHKSMVELRGETPADSPPEPDPDAIEKAAKLIGAAKQPMIFVGGGAYDAGPEIKALAEMLQAPVVAYQNGRGTLDERHYLAHVSTGGAILWRTCDVAIAIGSRLQGGRGGVIEGWVQGVPGIRKW